MVLIQFLLPSPSSGNPSTNAMGFRETRRELTEQFAGLTAYVRSPAKGVWTAEDGHTEQDDVVMIEIVASTFDRGWWRAYAAKLAQRFQQDAIHIRALAVQMLDEDPL